MADIIINEKFRTLIPPLNKAEYTELEKSLKKEASIPALLFFHIFLYGINIISNMTFADGYVYLQLLIFFRQRPEKREEKRDRNSS